MKTILITTILMLQFKVLATVTINIDAEKLKTDSGGLMSTNGLVILVASTNDSTFNGPTPTSFVSGDDIIVGSWDLAARGEEGWGEPGVFSGVANGLYGAWKPGNPLKLYWFPTLTLSSTAPGYGTTYGQFHSPTNIDGGVAWITPADGATVSMAFFTEDADFLNEGGSNPASAGLASSITPNPNTTIAITSSANPSPVGASVTLTATVSVVSPGTGTPGGAVQFKADGAPLGAPVSLSGGAASISTSSLSHGYHTVAAEYAGSASFNGSTNTMTPNLAVNTAPIARNATSSVRQGGVVNIPFNLGKYALATDPDGDAMTITSVAGASFGSVGTDGASISYTNTSGSAGAVDTVSFTVTDTFGGSDSATLQVRLDPATGANLVSATANGGFAHLTYAGIPGTDYVQDWAASINQPAWTPVWTNKADALGVLRFTNSLSSYPTNDFFRTRALP